MTNLLPFSQLLSTATIQGFLKRYITLSWVNWLKNGELSRRGQIYMEDPVDYLDTCEEDKLLNNTGLSQ